MYIVLGKNGYIAEAIAKELKSRDLPHIALSRTDIDYTDMRLLDLWISQNYYSKIVKNHNVSIINAAGYIGKPNVDACELAKADCTEGNVVFPALLADLCARKNYQYIHISSGCIYGGYEKDFTEDDPSNFNFQNGSFYSGTKALAETIVLKNNPKSYIFRLRIPFDEYSSSRNYITKMLNYSNLLDVRNSFSHRSDFAKYSLDLLEKAPSGIYNVTNKGSMTTKEVINMVQDYKISNKEFSFFTNLDKFMQEISAPRSNCVLDTKKIEQYIKIRTVSEAMEDAISKYK